ncbi:hypothetical protein NRB56_07130 [Nocardia sp. RB56]|uniref:Uncharacterized protein n=1 Tax=Nocardia aurantia TaxID=2585199 RepID=A0A7K0DHN0_9NOCA|nr:hypothetical protein [Nocardia aurantia]
MARNSRAEDDSGPGRFAPGRVVMMPPHVQFFLAVSRVTIAAKSSFWKDWFSWLSA